MAGEYEVEFVERTDREARFLVRGITPAFANGIRRAMVADVPTFSVDQVRVIENSSVMFDEQIGQARDHVHQRQHRRHVVMQRGVAALGGHVGGNLERRADYAVISGRFKRIRIQLFRIETMGVVLIFHDDVSVGQDAGAAPLFAGVA